MRLFRLNDVICLTPGARESSVKCHSHLWTTFQEATYSLKEGMVINANSFRSCLSHHGQDETRSGSLGVSPRSHIPLHPPWICGSGPHHTTDQPCNLESLPFSSLTPRIEVPSARQPQSPTRASKFLLEVNPGLTLIFLWAHTCVVAPFASETRESCQLYKWVY